MLLPMLGPITPYKRVCGAAFLVMMCVVPTVDFAVSLRWSASVGKLAACATSALLLFVLVPRVQRVSPITANALLSLALVVFVCNAIWEDSIRVGIASSIGLFDGVAPVARGGEPRMNSVPFIHPTAGYRVDIPSDWLREDLPGLGLTQFVLRDGADTLAEFRPHCDLLTPPIALQLFQALKANPKSRHRCYRWLADSEACLITAPQRFADTEGERWEWIGKHGESPFAVRLVFLLHQPTSSVRSAALRVIASTHLENPSTPYPQCLTPVEWAEES